MLTVTVDGAPGPSMTAILLVATAVPLTEHELAFLFKT